MLVVSVRGLGTQREGRAGRGGARGGGARTGRITAAADVADSGFRIHVHSGFAAAAAALSDNQLTY